MATEFSVRACGAALEREQAFDLRRSVLCGELHYSRALVDDGQDARDGVWLGLAWAGPKPVGTLRLQAQADGWLLEHLAVLPQWRRQGVASALLAAALEEARRRGAGGVLACGPAAAGAFFLARGFVVRQSSDTVLVWERLV